MNTSSNNENVGTVNPFAKSNVLTITDEKWNGKSKEYTNKTITDWLPSNDNDHQFSSCRYAILFEPGTYDAYFEVGYYVTVAGLGKTPESVKFVKPKHDGYSTGPYVNPIGSGNDAKCLDTFWRSAENFSAVNTRWAVSQAAPLRRIIVSDKLFLGKGKAFSSGGFIANADVNSIEYFSQQQWYCRNMHLNDKKPNDWGNFGHLVLSGCTGGHPKEKKNVTKTNPTVRVEKPFIVINAKKEYELHVPAPTRDSADTSGTNLKALTPEHRQVRPFIDLNDKKRRVIVVDPVTPGGKEIVDANYKVSYEQEKNEEKTKELQAVLDNGYDLIISPGIFFLTASLIVRKEHKNQVILGLGMATLVAPTNGSPCIKVKAHSEGIRIAGLLLEASEWDKSNTVKKGERSLLDFGTPTETKKNYPKSNPGALIDVFARVGGPGPFNLDVTVDTMIRIFSEYVVIDNSWYWRADHSKGHNSDQIGFSHFKVDTALHVFGDYVTVKGLSAEHTLKDNVVWDGNHGEIDFYQCEFPYYTPLSEHKIHDYSALKIGDNVTNFHASGVGVYDIFNDKTHAKHAISIPSNQKNITLKNPCSVHVASVGLIENVVKVRSNPPKFYPDPSVPTIADRARYAWNGDGNSPY